jgi:hypothetical protein
MLQFVLRKRSSIASVFPKLVDCGSVRLYLHQAKGLPEEGSFDENFLTFFVDSEPLKIF